MKYLDFKIDLSMKHRDFKASNVMEIPVTNSDYDRLRRAGGWAEEIADIYRKIYQHVVFEVSYDLDYQGILDRSKGESAEDFAYLTVAFPAAL